MVVPFTFGTITKASLTMPTDTSSPGKPSAKLCSSEGDSLMGIIRLKCAHQTERVICLVLSEHIHSWLYTVVHAVLRRD